MGPFSAIFFELCWHGSCYNDERKRDREHPRPHSDSYKQELSMRRWLLSLSAVALVAGFIATPAASAQQSVNLYVGGFTPRAEDARNGNDVLVHDRTFLDFNINDFHGATIGGEWLVG